MVVRSFSFTIRVGGLERSDAVPFLSTREAIPTDFVDDGLE